MCTRDYEVSLAANSLEKHVKKRGGVPKPFGQDFSLVGGALDCRAEGH